MKATLIDLFTSKKFLAALTAVVVYVAGRFGFDVDTATLDRILAAILVYIGAQGIADQGKSAELVRAANWPGLPAGIEPPVAVRDTPAESPRAIAALAGRLPPVAVLLLVVGLVGSTQLSCATIKAAPPVAEHAVIDCVRADQAPILELVVQLGVDALTYALHAAPVDWDALEASAWAQGKTTGGCALAQFVRALSTKQPIARALVGSVDPALAALERLRARAGGVQWRTAAGVL